MFRGLWHWMRTGLVLVAIGLASPAAARGTGSITDGKLDLLVYFAYPETDPSSWEPVFTEYSKLLLNATEGGLQLGTVRFTLCPDLQGDADVWVLNDFSGARAHLSGLGVPGRHMTISQTHKSISGAARGQFGLAHESGHYLFGVYDEYRGFVGDEPTTTSFHFCTFEDTTLACLMDGGTTVSPENLRTEFCTRERLGESESGHNRGVLAAGFAAQRTDQEYYLRRSCWEQIERSGVGGLTHPAGTLTTGTPPHSPVTFDYARLLGDVAVALVLDTSGSMSAEGRLESAVLGAKNGIGLMRDGEALAIVTFADAPSVLFSATEMTAARRAQANARLDGVTAGGGTRLGTAVLAAVDELKRFDGCVEFVVVVTDGQSAAPGIDDSAVLSALAAGEHAVYAVAVGSFPDVTALNAVAVATGGRFFSVADSSELPGVLATIFATAGSGTPVLESFEDSVAVGTTETRPFSVGENAASLRVDLSFAAGADLGLELVAPDGSTISFDAPPTGAEAFESNVQKALTLVDPSPGDWQAAIDDPLGSGATFDLLVIVEALDLDVTVTAREHEVGYPEPMNVSVGVVAGVPVGGAVVTANVDRPDGSSVPVTLFDDGLAVHGDAQRGDGVYSLLFARYAGNGAYTFRIEIDASDAVPTSSQECGRFGEDGGASAQVPPFVSCVTHTLLLNGQTGAPQPGTALVGAHTELAPAGTVPLASAPTPVAGFRVDVSAHEPLVLGSLVLPLRSVGADVERARGLALHRDADGDGKLDVPSVPLALAKLAGDGGRLIFEQPGGELAFLAADASHAFLITAGVGLESADEEEVGGGAGPVESARVPGGALPGLALALGLLMLLASRMARAHGDAPARRPRAAVLGLGFVVLLVAVGFPACSDGSRESLRLSIAPDGIELTGAVTGTAVEAEGTRATYSLRLR